MWFRTVAMSTPNTAAAFPQLLKLFRQYYMLRRHCYFTVRKLNMLVVSDRWFEMCAKPKNQITAVQC